VAQDAAEPEKENSMDGRFESSSSEKQCKSKKTYV
jgi:hypothetical protein